MGLVLLLCSSPESTLREILPGRPAPDRAERTEGLRAGAYAPACAQA